MENQQQSSLKDSQKNIQEQFSLQQNITNQSDQNDKQSLSDQQQIIEQKFQLKNSQTSVQQNSQQSLKKSTTLPVLKKTVITLDSQKRKESLQEFEKIQSKNQQSLKDMIKLSQTENIHINQPQSSPNIKNNVIDQNSQTIFTSQNQRQIEQDFHKKISDSNIKKEFEDIKESSEIREDNSSKNTQNKRIQNDFKPLSNKSDSNQNYQSDKNLNQNLQKNLSLKNEKSDEKNSSQVIKEQNNYVYNENLNSFHQKSKNFDFTQNIDSKSQKNENDNKNEKYSQESQNSIVKAITVSREKMLMEKKNSLQNVKRNENNFEILFNLEKEKTKSLENMILKMQQTIDEQEQIIDQQKIEKKLIVEQYEQILRNHQKTSRYEEKLQKLEKQKNKIQKSIEKIHNTQFPQQKTLQKSPQQNEQEKPMRIEIEKFIHQQPKYQHVDQYPITNSTRLVRINGAEVYRKNGPLGYINCKSYLNKYNQ